MKTTDTLTSKGREGMEGYDEFMDKFKPKLTTDDCYTPAPVYDAVLGFVRKTWDVAGREVVRPFFPGGDYKRLDQYPAGCVVVDNPPFSILSQILRYYCAHGVEFFLFAPALTLFSSPDCDLTYIITDACITYENGAVVRTGFITNLPSDLRIWLCPELKAAVDAAQPSEDKTLRGFVYPDNIVTAATLGTIAKRSVELKIRKVSCHYVKTSESAKRQGRTLFGGGFMLSERAAAERAAAERAAAERAAATKLTLTPKERALIAFLNKRERLAGITD